ncbi:glycosyltransferase [Brachyspira hampsonii]|uniref:glycosyltransferase n=1 Tax=Brachyspira hampsonii TaxID=1287055 RepID=UPI0015E7AC66|nr:glycosyltransferase [Brachyspira hampsonii]
MWKNIKKWQETFKKNGDPVWHYSVFIKLDIPIILKDLDNVLFIDADSIVLGSLDYIFDIDISNCSFVSQISYFKYLKKLYPNLYKYMLDIGYKKPEYDYIFGQVLFFNIKRIKEIFTEESYYNKIDECIDKYINLIHTEEHIFLYLFKGNNVYLDLKTDLNNGTEKIIISGYFAGDGKPLNYGFNGEINEYYYKFWEYFSLTPFFKENTIKYMEILSINRTRMALCKIVDKMVWIIPFKKMRDKIRKNIIKDIDEIMKNMSNIKII